ncbi:hypothetical protein [Neochlamydia sp. AcF65]|nr:hypothetical protein [Neochlamydia sp. AcF65]
MAHACFIMCRHGIELEIKLDYEVWHRRFSSFIKNKIPCGDTLRE